MTGLSPRGGWAGHPDLMGKAADVLKVTAVGRHSLRAAAHDGGRDCVSSERDTNSGRQLSVVYCSSLICTLIVSPLGGFITPTASHPPSLSETAHCMSQHLWNLEPLHQCRLDLQLRYLSAACEEQIRLLMASVEGSPISLSAIYRQYISLSLITASNSFARIMVHAPL